MKLSEYIDVLQRFREDNYDCDPKVQFNGHEIADGVVLMDLMCFPIEAGVNPFKWTHLNFRIKDEDEKKIVHKLIEEISITQNEQTP